MKRVNYGALFVDDSEIWEVLTNNVPEMKTWESIDQVQVQIQESITQNTQDILADVISHSRQQ